MSWADAPVAGRRPCRWSSPIAGTDRMAPPRSAVAVSPSAPGLTPLTGFSRSGSPSSLCWLAVAGEVLVQDPVPSLSLTAESVDTRWRAGVSSVPALCETTTSASAAGEVSLSLRPLRVRSLSEGRLTSAFRARQAGRPIGPESRRSCMGQTSPSIPPHRPQELCSRGDR